MLCEWSASLWLRVEQSFCYVPFHTSQQVTLLVISPAKQHCFHPTTITSLTHLHSPDLPRQSYTYSLEQALHWSSPITNPNPKTPHNNKHNERTGQIFNLTTTPPQPRRPGWTCSPSLLTVVNTTTTTPRSISIYLEPLAPAAMSNSGRVDCVMVRWKTSAGKRKAGCLGTFHGFRSVDEQCKDWRHYIRITNEVGYPESPPIFFRPQSIYVWAKPFHWLWRSGRGSVAFHVRR